MRVIRWIALLAGVVLFGVSFMLPAVKEASAGPHATGMPGYKCATLTLIVPWGSDGFRLLRQSPLQYFAILFSGWINPAFVIALLLVLFKPRWRPALVFRWVVTFMFVSCWIVFYEVHLHPLTGYFVWMFGILLTLFSNKLGEVNRAQEQAPFSEKGLK
ncbi:MAG TPA: hypothetical protein VLT16_07215 [Candidatus Limnocylindrales bacterium]|nr:hypothetical protein [Candidatus Limnocylindrales bacterium]